MPSAPTRTHMILHPTTDNVAIALKPFDANETIEGITIKEPIRAYHKIALTDLAMDQAVYKYGQIIGYTTQPVTAGNSEYSTPINSSASSAWARVAAATAAMGSPCQRARPTASGYWGGERMPCKWVRTPT